MKHTDQEPLVRWKLSPAANTWSFLFMNNSVHYICSNFIANLPIHYLLLLFHIRLLWLAKNCPHCTPVRAISVKKVHPSINDNDHTALRIPWLTSSASWWSWSAYEINYAHNCTRHKRQYNQWFSDRIRSNDQKPHTHANAMAIWKKNIAITFGVGRHWLQSRLPLSQLHTK